MDFTLDYEKMVLLDAEDLAEGGIKNAYDDLLSELGRYVSTPAVIQEVNDWEAPRYAVQFGGEEYLICSPELPNDEGQSWGRATYVFFKIVNAQLTQSAYRFYAINGGNDLGGMFLTESECEAARKSLPRKEDWPYLPTPEHLW